MKKKIYHGSKDIIEKPEFGKGNQKNDYKSSKKDKSVLLSINPYSIITDSKLPVSLNI